MSLRKARLASAGLLLLSFVGLWLGHTLEYARVWGAAGLREELTGSVHGYMVFLALVLALLAAATGLRLWTIWSHLGRRLEAGRLALARIWRGRRPVALEHHDDEPVSFSARVITLWLPLTLLQIGFYLLQENVEHIAAGYPAPGLGPLTGIHWAAPLVHAGVALAVASLVTLVVRAFRQRVAVVAAVAAMVRALASFLRRPQALRPRVIAAQLPPLQVHGCQLWSRPPPILSPV